MRYVFGDYALDTQRQEFSLAGQPIALRPKVFLFLAYLVQHHDRVVSKSELLEQIWPDQFISDATLNACLKELRQAVGDTGRTQQVIHTLRGRGYRFVAAFQVRTAPESAAVRPAPVTPVPAEVYKHVTVLVCALVSDSSRATALEAEGRHALMQALFTQAQEATQRYDGSIVYWDGQGFTALFGASVAYEDHAWRALLAACDLHEQGQRYLTLTGHPAPHILSLTIGLHTGLALIGRLEHTSPLLYTAAGPTTHLAVRLQRLAAPGEILMSEATYRYVRDAVQVQRRGTLAVTAEAPPCGAYAVQGLVARQPEAMPGRGRRPRSRFVGRERELAILHARLAQVQHGQGHVVSVMGEAGIGKSRLCAEWHRHLSAQAVTYGVDRCLSYGGATPYTPVISLLRDLCGIHATDPPAVAASRLQRCLHDVGLLSDEWAPYLQQLLGLSAETALPSARRPSNGARLPPYATFSWR